MQSIEPFVNIGNDSSFVSLLEQTQPLEASSSISTTVYGEPEMNSSTGSQKMALHNMTSQLSITQHVSLPVTSDHDLHPRESETLFILLIFHISLICHLTSIQRLRIIMKMATLSMHDLHFK